MLPNSSQTVGNLYRCYLILLRPWEPFICYHILHRPYGTLYRCYLILLRLWEQRVPVIWIHPVNVGKESENLPQRVPVIW